MVSPLKTTVMKLHPLVRQNVQYADKVVIINIFSLSVCFSIIHQYCQILLYFSDQHHRNNYHQGYYKDRREIKCNVFEILQYLDCRVGYFRWNFSVGVIATEN